MGLRVFIDTDVFISSLLSKKGAAFELLTKQSRLKKYISNYSQKEIFRTAQKLKIEKNKVKKKLQQCQQINISQSIKKILQTYISYVNDKNDAHILAGAIKSNSKFLVTYNLRDYKINLIKNDFEIICLKPANLLQILRNKTS